MKKVFTLFTIVAAAITTLTGCKDDFPKTPNAEPYLNLTTSATTIALGGEGTLEVKTDRTTSGLIDVTLTSSTPGLTIASSKLSIDPNTTDKSAKTTFTANAVGEATVKIASDYPGVSFVTKSVIINVVKPQLVISGAKTCEAGKEASFNITSNMNVIDDVIITLTSSDPTKLTVPETVTLKKGTKNIEGKMKGVADGEATLSFTITNEKVEIGKNETTNQPLNTVKVNVEAGPTPANITFSGTANAVVGEEQTFTITSDVEVSENVTFTITSLTVATATIVDATVVMTAGTKTATGKYSAVAAGTTTITVASENTTVVIADTKKSFDVTVTAAPAL